MDYGSGFHLHKYQWDLIHNPERHLGWFDEDEEGESGVALPCIMPVDGYLVTPDHVGIYVPQGTRISFFPDVNNNRDGKLSGITNQSGTYVAQFTGNGSFLGYRNGAGGVYNATGSRNLLRNKYFLGVVQSYGDNCSCIIFPYYGVISVTTDGRDDEGANAPENYPGTFPEPVGQYDYVSEIILQAISSSYCNDAPSGGGEEEEGVSISGSLTALQEQLAELPAFMASNGYNGQFFLWDETRNEVKIYRPGQEVQTLTGQAADGVRRQFEQETLPGQPGFAAWITYGGEGEGNIRIQLSLSDDFVTPHPSYQYRPDGSRVDIEELKDQIKEQVASKIASLSDISSPVLTEYLRQEGADGALEVKESGLLKWISFGVSETAHLVRNAKLDDGLWDDGQGSYGGKLVHVFAPLAGVTDQTLAEIRDLYEMAGMVGQVWDNPRSVVEDLYGFYEQLSVDAVRRMVSEGIRSEIGALSTPGVQRQYKLGGYVVQAVVAIAAITKEGQELILDFAERFGQKADNIRDFVGNFTQELGERFQLLSPEQKGAFFEDFAGDADAVEAFNDKPELVDGWEFAENCPEGVRKNTDVLEGLGVAVNRARRSVEEVVSHAGLPDVITNSTVTHIFRGDSGGGRHHISAILDDNARRLVDRVAETSEGFYGAVFSSGGRKSFWPDAWDEFRVIDELKYVLENSPTNVAGNRWQGRTQGGQLIEYFRHTDGHIISAFPVLPNFP